MLNIYFFNVGHGDSIAINFPDNSWGVIDCNRNKGETEPNILKFLKRREVTSLRFICLTHPHDDHFKGIDKIIEHFKENIGIFYTYNRRVGSRNEYSLKDKEDTCLIKFYKNLIKVSNETGKNNLIKCLRRNDKINIGEVEIKVLNPTEELINDISFKSYGDDSIFNAVSVVLQLSYSGTNTILGADATNENWTNIISGYKSKNQTSKLLSDILKISHHGSKEGNSKITLDTITRRKTGIAVISTDGGKRYSSLPNQEIIKHLKENRKITVFRTDDISPKINLPDKIEKVGQTDIIEAGLLMGTNPVKQAYYDGYIKVTIDINGKIVTQILDNI